MVALLGVGSITQVAAGFFAVGAGVAIACKINKLHHIVLLVCLAHTEHIHIGLHAGFADKQIYRHLNAGQKRIARQNPFVVFSSLAGAGAALDDDSSKAPLHHRKRLFDKHHTVTIGRIRRIQHKGIGRIFADGAAEAIITVVILKGILVHNVRAAIAHKDHVKNGQHINIRQNLQAQKLLRLDMHFLLLQLLRRGDAVFGIYKHFVHSRH